MCPHEILNSTGHLDERRRQLPCKQSRKRAGANNAGKTRDHDGKANGTGRCQHHGTGQYIEYAYPWTARRPCPCHRGANSLTRPIDRRGRCDDCVLFKHARKGWEIILPALWGSYIKTIFTPSIGMKEIVPALIDGVCVGATRRLRTNSIE